MSLRHIRLQYENTHYLPRPPGKELPSLMKSTHLRQALYAGEILLERKTSALATPDILSHHGQNTGSVFLSTSRTGIGMVSVFSSIKSPMSANSSCALHKLRFRFTPSDILPEVLADSAISLVFAQLPSPKKLY